MDVTERIANLIDPVLLDMGYERVRVLVNGSNRPVLQIMAERLDGRGMTVDDCADISRMLSPVLDVADPISSAYRLEVSSAGIDRPLTRLKDFQDWAGHEVRLEVRMPVKDRKRFAGILKGLSENGENVLVEGDFGLAELPWPLVQKARLVLTDALIADTIARQVAAGGASSGALAEGGDFFADDADSDDFQPTTVTQ
jgi:ribosome maturation factor RimP